eukprot:9346213-Heterocapsa_arctica.AAC.1
MMRCQSDSPDYITYGLGSARSGLYSSGANVPPSPDADRMVLSRPGMLACASPRGHTQGQAENR